MSRAVVVGALIASGCAVGSLPPDEVIRPRLTSPEILSVELECDPAAARWTVAAAASSWTSGGALWLTVDGSYIEEHTVRTREAEPDGSGEALGAELAIASDWRAAGDGTTAFVCAAAPSWRFRITDTDGAPSDCAGSGDAPWPDDGPACQPEDD